MSMVVVLNVTQYLRYEYFESVIEERNISYVEESFISNDTNSSAGNSSSQGISVNRTYFRLTNVTVKVKRLYLQGGDLITFRRDPHLQIRIIYATNSLENRLNCTKIFHCPPLTLLI